MRPTWKTITIRIPWLAKPCWCGEMNCARTSHQKPSRRSAASRKRQSEARKASWKLKKAAATKVEEAQKDYEEADDRAHEAVSHE